MEQTCSNGYCNYRYQNQTSWGCSYQGYCDFQRPLDSRLNPPLHSDFILNSLQIYCICAGQEGNDGICLMCHLPKKKELI